MKKIYVLLTIIMILISACQPTPEAQVVREKNEEGIIEAIEKEDAGNSLTETSSPSYQYNQTWQEKIEGQNDKLSVTVSADVFVPNDGNMPIASVYPTYISEEIAAKMMNVLGQGNAFYPMSKVRTKDDLMAEILELKEWLANPSGDLYTDRGKYPDKWQKFVDGKQKRVEQLQTEYQSAPESIEEKPLEAVYHSTVDNNIEGMTALYEELETQLNEATSAEEKEEIGIMMNDMQMVIEGNEYDFQISGTADLGKDDVARITITKKINYPEYNSARFTGLYDNETIFELPLDEVCNKVIHKNFDAVNGLSLGYDQALQIAEKAIMDMGLEDMRFADAQIIGKANATTNIDKWKDAYRFAFTRQVENVQVTPDITSINYSEALNKAWRNEYIEIYIDDTGIVKFTWTAPAEIKEVLATNVQLLSFEQMQNIFRNYIYIKGAYDEDEDIISRQTTITEVRLGLMQVQSTQSDTGYLLIPVWDFYGYDVNTYSDDTKLVLDESNELTIVNHNVSYLTINAIDGSIIDRSLGY